MQLHSCSWCSWTVLDYRWLYPLNSVALRGDVNQAQVKLVRRNCSPCSAHRTAQTMLTVPNLSRWGVQKTHRQSKIFWISSSCPQWPTKRNEFRQNANKQPPAALRPRCLRKACQHCAYFRSKKHWGKVKNDKDCRKTYQDISHDYHMQRWNCMACMVCMGVFDVFWYFWPCLTSQGDAGFPQLRNEMVEAFRTWTLEELQWSLQSCSAVQSLSTISASPDLQPSGFLQLNLQNLDAGSWRQLCSRHDFWKIGSNKCTPSASTLKYVVL
jgi:hypothetical protein